jgi:hypothetical protein
VKKNRVRETIGWKKTRWAQRAREEPPSFCVSCSTLSIFTDSPNARKNLKLTDSNREFSAESSVGILIMIYLKNNRW